MIVQMYRNSAQLVLLALRYLQASSSVDTYGLTRYFKPPERRTSVQTIDNAYYSLLKEPIELHQVVKDLEEQLIQTQADRCEGQVLDTIIELLGLPYSKNRITSNTLTKLRRALLLPYEAAALNMNLERQELYCHACARRFEDREMLTLVMENREPVLMCALCLPPNVFRCQNCHGPMEIAKNVHSAMKRTGVCEGCRNSSTVPKQQHVTGAVPTLPTRWPLNRAAGLGDGAPTEMDPE